MALSFKPNILNNQVAVITGGGSGIGEVISRCLMQHGCSTAILSRRLPMLQAVAQKLTEETGQQCLPVKVDVRDPTSIKEAINEVMQKYGRIDILVNGAAGNFLSSVAKLSTKAFKAVMETDAHGTFSVSKIVHELAFSKQKSGRIINISMTLHYSGTVLQVHAGMAKAAIDSMTKHLAVEWGPLNIKVNGVAPGFIENTPGFDKLTPSGSEDVIPVAKITPLQRCGTKQDIANVCLFLCTPESDFITGQTIVVDGGQAFTSSNYPLLDPQIRKQWISGSFNLSKL